MVIKKSSKNQIAIPAALLKEAGLGSEDIYFDITYKNGCLVMKPMQMEEKIPVEAIRRFEKKALKHSAGDKVFSSLDEGLAWLKKRK
jgi:hypothetical protein